VDINVEFGLGSIPVDVFLAASELEAQDVDMATGPPRQEESRLRGLWEVATSLERKLISGFVVLVLGIGIWLIARIDGLDGRLRRVENNLSAVPRDPSGIDSRLKGFEDTLGKLQEFLYARPRAQAASLGLQNASILPVSLRTGVEFTVSDRLTPELSFAIQYTFLEITKDSARVRLGGKVGTYTFHDVLIVFPLTPGVLTRIPMNLGNVPDLYIVVLDRPSPDSAILAVGPKAS
jgi:hypothetical protein